MPGRLQKVAALVAAAGGIAAPSFAAEPAATPLPLAAASALEAQRDRGTVELSEGNSQGKWTLRAASSRGAWDPADAFAFPRFDWRSAVMGDTARANLSFDWTRHLAAGSLDGRISGRLARTDVGDGITGATHFEQRLHESALGGALRWTDLDHSLSASFRRSGRDAESGAADERGELHLDRQDRLDESMLSLAASTRVFLPARIRADLGMRYDIYRGAVRSDVHAREGDLSAQALSPHLKLRAPGPGDSEMFVALARGNEICCGLAAMVDPRDGAPVARLDPLATTRTVEIGFKRRLPPGIEATVSMFRARSQLEILLTGESAFTEFARPSVRQGVQLAATYEPMRWLMLDFHAVALRARFADRAAEYIPGAVERGAAAGATIRVPAGWTASLMVNYLGKRSGLDEEARLRASTFVNGRLSRNLSKSTRVTLDVFNVFDQRLRDVDYFSASRMANASGPSDGYLFNPAEPRGVRLKLRTTF